MVRPYLEPRIKGGLNGLSVEEQVLAFLAYTGQNGMQNTVGVLLGISQASVSRAVSYL